MPTTSFQDISRYLTQDQTPRVWSFLISVFGELAQDTGAKISGALLSRITEEIGIKPEAMRVAIHRLRKDGWIDSLRAGRSSSYFLTPRGRAQSAQASPRIYASGPAADRAWLIMHNPGQSAQPSDMPAAWITSSICITSVVPASAQILAVPLDADTALPQWMTSRVCDDETVEMSKEFATKLEGVNTFLKTAPHLSPLEITALRVLLVHSWRRIILKAPILPDHVFPTSWRGSICRQAVAELLTQYPKRALDELETTTDS
ncbi:Transcriptional repressor PaaX [Roseobacter fucihabitans]|uniref:Transcriptional repressor PaaX n=1 Tax=Roseobacter fucihabitans TaxID=1537242 RepID=A0ABZ2BZT7_9RHOB|nr:PaaX family transcriptional regulator C-terminal domain-containing protein [Roseobacter litoralis]MBC6963747.1 Transcriptional repressor PaaX [Roseobacter litoralis]